VGQDDLFTGLGGAEVLAVADSQHFAVAAQARAEVAAELPIGTGEKKTVEA
jgi:hypothetical protein